MNYPGWLKIPGPQIPMIDRNTISCDTYIKSPLCVILAIENHGGKIVRHMSISCKNRYPTWDEIKEARYTFFDEKHEAVMMFPPKSEYVNLHENTFHLWAKANGSRWE